MRSAVRKGLSQAKILEEARTLLDAGGPAALTMRALAGRLDVAAMAVYNHFQDRDAILDAIADDVFAQLRRVPERMGRAKWRAKLKMVLMNAVRLATEHPHIFQIAMTRPNKPASAFTLTTESLEVLTGLGLTGVQATTVYHTFTILLQGYPFWREGLNRYDPQKAEAAGVPQQFCAPGVTAEQQFEAIADWLLGCVSQMNKQVRKKPNARVRTV